MFMKKGNKYLRERERICYEVLGLFHEAIKIIENKAFNIQKILKPHACSTHTLIVINLKQKSESRIQCGQLKQQLKSLNNHISQILFQFSTTTQYYNTLFDPIPLWINGPTLYYLDWPLFSLKRLRLRLLPLFINSVASIHNPTNFKSRIWYKTLNSQLFKERFLINNLS